MRLAWRIDFVPHSIDMDSFWGISTILPVVAFVKEKFTVNINKTEVDELFEVPLDFILDSKNHVLKSGFWNGAVRHYYTINYSHYNIWGATAGMLVNLFERIKANA